MKRLSSILAIVAATTFMSACSTTGGTLLGAAAGAGIGHEVSGGSAAGAVGGAAVGGIIGHELSR